MKARAVAHPNIALVKYWGKRDRELNLPAAGSLSVTLAGLETSTEVAFGREPGDDVIELDGERLDADDRRHARVSSFLDLVRARAGLETSARVRSRNDFPTGAGLASSASGFAALALAATSAADLELDPPALSRLARRGSGSAARSILGGFVEMRAGRAPDGSDAYAVNCAPPDHWELRCLIAVTRRGSKDLGSTAGMLRTERTSPYYAAWVEEAAAAIAAARAAVGARDFSELTSIAEASCLRMHASAMAAEPGILYWNGATVELIHRVRRARRAGLEVFFTIDAGPHVKVFCTIEARDEARALLEEVPGVLEIIEASPGPGARLVDVDGAAR
jgi:diphosphomevalonate decarboxylase